VYNLIKGMRVIEAASFIAAPSCGLHLLQMGAEVIRVDDVRGGPDFARWPLAPGGASLYWEGLNKGKKSVAVDLSRPEGRELASALVTAPGPDGGLFVTNYPARGFFSHEALSRTRSDLITLRIMGLADERPAVDYTVNCAVGVPAMTGPVDEPGPVNHVLPAWDLMAGAYGAFALLAAERERTSSGIGGEIRLPLADLAIATIANLGQVAEISATGEDRRRFGNDLFGAFGRDFETADQRRVMLVAITQRQWRGLVSSLNLGEPIERLELELGVSFLADEGARFVHRDRLFPLVEATMRNRHLTELAPVFDRNGVCWGEYRSVRQALEENESFSARNPLLSWVTHPSGLTYLTPGSPVTLPGSERAPAPSAPRLGEHTDEVLARVLGLPDSQIGSLHDQQLIAGPRQPG
jgi:2-methylfumaryl-CoA isomerase